MKTFKKLNGSLTIAIAALGVAAATSLRAQGCCSEGATIKEGCTMGPHDMSTHEGHGADASASHGTASTKGVFMQPVQSVFDNYIQVQGTLTQDSLEGVSKSAAAMARAIQSDSMHMLPAKVGHQAEALAQAKDLDSARSAYKSLSASLIKYVKEQKLPPGTYYEAYCPMAKASWLQTGKTIMNPYMGKGMIHCGEIKS